MKHSLTLDQQRAEYAWRAAKRADEKGRIEEYTNLVKSAASLVMGSGLMQTLAFLQAKNKNGDAHSLLLNDLCCWLGSVFGNTRIANGKRFPDKQQIKFETAMNALHQSPTDVYMRASRETMELFRWLRQLSDACKSMKSCARENT